MGISLVNQIREVTSAERKKQERDIKEIPGRQTTCLESSKCMAVLENLK